MTLMRWPFLQIGADKPALHAQKHQQAEQAGQKHNSDNHLLHADDFCCHLHKTLYAYLFILTRTKDAARSPDKKGKKHASQKGQSD